MSCHLFVQLGGIPDAVHPSYRAILEEVPGLSRTYLQAKYLDVLEALLWGFHNARSGLCFPSLAKIAEAARCAPSTVAEAIKALEAMIEAKPSAPAFGLVQLGFEGALDADDVAVA
jgi:hypothetical protein